MSNRFAGALLRMHRLKKNWSQETLCSGICAVSYLSKIEQGRVEPNDSVLTALFSKLGLGWAADTGENEKLCTLAYETIFSRDWDRFSELRSKFDKYGTDGLYSSSYLDALCIKAFINWDDTLIPPQILPLLDLRQRCLVHILKKDYAAALQSYPCALTMMLSGSAHYGQGSYALALEQLQQGYDSASQNGYIHIMLHCQVIMGNVYSDQHDLFQMERHYEVALRIAAIIHDGQMEETIQYNIYSTKIECGLYEDAYGYFASKAPDDILSLHKLAICCEMLGKREEALAAIERAIAASDGLERKMCGLVHYRLTHADYLKQSEYGAMLMDLFKELRAERSAGYARFHLHWVEEWCIANRQYRAAYELLKEFS